VVWKYFKIPVRGRRVLWNKPVPGQHTNWVCLHGWTRNNRQQFAGYLYTIVWGYRGGTWWRMAGLTPWGWEQEAIWKLSSQSKEKRPEGRIIRVNTCLNSYHTYLLLFGSNQIENISSHESTTIKLLVSVKRKKILFNVFLFRFCWQRCDVF
jgi:hypothetical protein